MNKNKSIKVHQVMKDGVELLSLGIKFEKFKYSCSIFDFQKGEPCQGKLDKSCHSFCGLKTKLIVIRFI